MLEAFRKARPAQTAATPLKMKANSQQLAGRRKDRRRNGWRADLLNAPLFFTPLPLILLFESGLLRCNLIVLGGASEDEQRGNQREEGRGKSHKGHSITIFGFSPQEKNSAALRLTDCAEQVNFSTSRRRVETRPNRNDRLRANAGHSVAP